MTTQSFYTPTKAAEMIGCKESEVLEYIKSGQLKASFMSNIANYVITHNDLMSFLKSTRDFKTMQKMLATVAGVNDVRLPVVPIEYCETLLPEEFAT